MESNQSAATDKTGWYDRRPGTGDARTREHPEGVVRIFYLCHDGEERWLHVLPSGIYLSPTPLERGHPQSWIMTGIDLASKTPVRLSLFRIREVRPITGISPVQEILRPPADVDEVERWARGFVYGENFRNLINLCNELRELRKVVKKNSLALDEPSC